jgi:hypothetical protein
VVRAVGGGVVSGVGWKNGDGSLTVRACLLAYRMGEPFARHDAAAIAATNALIDEFYKLPGNSTGGLLHIVLDDSNWEDEHIEFCREQARAAGDETAYWLTQLLLSFPFEERAAFDIDAPTPSTGS